MAFWTYLLLCAEGLYYTGHTDDLERRIGEHMSGQIKGFTSSRLPVQLVWADYFQTRAEAIENELRVKKWSKAKKKALTAQDWDKLAYFSKPPSERGATPPGASSSLRISSSLDTNGEGELNKGGSFTPPSPIPFVSSPSAGLQPLRINLAVGQDETPLSNKPKPPKCP